MYQADQDPRNNLRSTSVNQMRLSNSSNSSINNNVSTVQFELTDESSLLKPPIASLSVALSRERKNKNTPKSATSVKYIFLKQEHENSNKILSTKHLSLNA